jgi:hypothetical protein
MIIMPSSLRYLQTFRSNENSRRILLPSEVPGWLAETLYVNISSILGASYPATSFDYSYVKAFEMICGFSFQIMGCVTVEN